ncbi:type IV conjugative transfer system protein TraL [Eilatimonas milleporae]|uniref:Type IV conjugative transfer system protein TraL n=1 Tax=Eilatimonas milleporae TaxID=911205 RepID=A0A3M0C5B7_9PROT|nr:type IV conjugative transfer system protein TraL [Eilatimonas milleporae]RMB05041.1 type IV conjugative transfer system protein TraL [Eilatimonas milleporae]
MARMPQYLHQDWRFIGLDSQEITLAALCYIFSLIIGGWATVVLIVLLYQFIRFKRSKPRGYMAHLFYRLGFGHFRGYPIAAAETFHE